MTYISADPSIWNFMSSINELELLFKLPYIYLMNKELAYKQQLGLCNKLINQGINLIDWSEGDFYLTLDYKTKYVRLTSFDCSVLAIAKNRNISICTNSAYISDAAIKEEILTKNLYEMFEDLFIKRLITHDKYKELLLKILSKNNLDNSFDKEVVYDLDNLTNLNNTSLD